MLYYVILTKHSLFRDICGIFSLRSNANGTLQDGIERGPSSAGEKVGEERLRSLVTSLKKNHLFKCGIFSLRYSGTRCTAVSDKVSY